MTLAYVVLPTTIQQKKSSDQKHSDIRQDTVLYDSIKLNSNCPVGEGDYFNCQRGQKLNAVIYPLFRVQNSIFYLKIVPYNSKELNVHPSNTVIIV